MTGSGTLSKRMQEYFNNATRRQLEFQLNVVEFRQLVNDLCHYCGSAGRMGIDRVLNNVGYINGNCVSACQTCNFMKGEMSYEAFLKMCCKIAAKHNK